MSLVDNSSEAFTTTTLLSTILKTTTTTVRTSNDSFLTKIEHDFKALEPLQVFMLLFTCVAVICWCVYTLLYSSRVLGFLITLLLSKFYKGAYLKIGSFSVSVLGGKLMFRDIQYITEDASIRIRYAWAIFRWWGPYKAKDVTMNLSNEPIRLEFYAEGIELHIYNRSNEYARLEKLFGLDELMLPPEPPGGGRHKQDQQALNGTPSKSTKQKAKKKAKKSSFNWRALVPVIKVDIVDGQALFGNPLLPTTLMIKFAEAKGTYSTKKASNPTDLFTHVVVGNVELLRVLLVPSTGYTGVQDKPPRNMGEGFVVAQTHRAEVYFYMDEPGTVPYTPEVLQMANGEVVMKQTFPEWGLEIKCSKTTPKKTALCMTNISYGPWADRQRASLFKFFYPADHQTHAIMELPQPGEKRVHRQFDFRLTVLVDTMIDVLYTKDKEMHALHMQAGPGSSLAFTLPLFVEDPSGYTTTIRGQLLHAESTTSLAYRDLLRAETLDFDLQLHYPRCWNDLQDWRIKLTAHKATVFFLYEHVDFIFDMISDWNSPETVPSIFSFVPYTVNFEVQLKEFEVIFITNEHNWVNTSSSSSDENAHLAICGDLLSIPVILPFHEFLPEVVVYKIDVSGECIDVRLFLPESNTSHQLLQNLANNARIVDRNGVLLEQPFGAHSNKWRKVTQLRDGWVDVMSTPMVGVNVKFANHPRHTLNDETYDDMIASLYGPAYSLSSPTASTLSHTSQLHPDSSACPVDFDRTILPPDEVTVDVEVAASEIMLYGSLLKYFLHLKENYLGEDLKMADTASTGVPSTNLPEHQGSTVAATSAAARRTSTSRDSTQSKDKRKRFRLPTKQHFDPRAYRSYAVKVSVILHEIQGHLVQHCSPSSPPCPTVYVDGLVFEMDKRYEETKLQVVVSPVTLLAWDSYKRQRADGSAGDSHLQQGHLTLSGLQVRGHGMFSHCGLPLESDTVEYAWLMELTVGDLKGKITAPQLHSIVQFLRTGLFLIDDVENQLCRPSPEMCQHLNLQPSCKLSHQALIEHRQNSGTTSAVAGGEEPARSWSVTAAVTDDDDEVTVCPTEGDIKYKMTRCSIDLIDVCLAETGVALNVQVYPIRVATCNLHGANNKAGVTALIQCIHLKQYICVSPTAASGGSMAGAAAAAAVPTAATTTSGGSGSATLGERKQLWVEAGALVLGPVNVDAAMSLPVPEMRMLQHAFLQRHDRRRHHLWFLWPECQASAAALGEASVRYPSAAGGGSGRCACHGDCAFFGRNENGRVFFHAAQSADFTGEARSMLAVPRLTDPPRDPGYGQSILQQFAFVLDMPDVLPAGRAPSVLLSSGLRSGTGKEGRSGGRASRVPSQQQLQLGGARWHAGRSPAAATASGVDEGSAAATADGYDHPSPSSTLKPGPSSSSRRAAAGAGFSFRLSSSPGSVGGGGGGGGTSADEEDSDESEAVTVVGRSAGSPTGKGSRPAVAGRWPAARASKRYSPDRVASARRAAATAAMVAVPASQAGSARLRRNAPGMSSLDGISAAKAGTSLGSSDSFYSAGSSFSVSQQQPPPRWTRQISTNSEGTRVRAGARVASPTTAVAAAAFSGSSTQSLYELAQSFFSPEGAPDALGMPPDARPEWYSDSSDLDAEQDIPPRLVFEDDEHEDDYEFGTNTNINADTWAADATVGHTVPSLSNLCADQFTKSSNLVDLQGQLKDKITKSALLMSCYMRHLTRLRCLSWSAQPQPPHIQQLAGSPLVDKQVVNSFGMSGICSPRFTTISKGFSPDVMRIKKSGLWQSEVSDDSSSSSTSRADSPSNLTMHEARHANFQEAHTDLGREEQTEGYSKTTAICRVMGSIDILISPLSLEAVQRYIEALTPVLASEHPAAVIDNLHFDVSANVQSQNKIKKMQARLEMQERPSDGTDVLGDRGRGTGAKEGTKLLLSKTATALLPQLRRQRTSTVLTVPQTRLGHDPQRDWRLQVMVTVAKVNVCILQASVSEDLTPTSAGECMRDLTCVSVLAVCLYDISFTSLLHSHSRSLCCPAGGGGGIDTAGADGGVDGLLLQPKSAATAPITEAGGAASAATASNTATLIHRSSSAVGGSDARPTAALSVTSPMTVTASPDDDVFEEAPEPVSSGHTALAVTLTAAALPVPQPSSSAAATADSVGASGARPLSTAGDFDDTEGLEQNTEEIVGNLTVKQVHCQFRRLVDGDLPQNIKLTAIPENRSRVMFTIAQQAPGTRSSPLPPDHLVQQRHRRQKPSVSKTSSFIMFECGVDNLSVNAARRRGFSTVHSAAGTMSSDCRTQGDPVALPPAQPPTRYFVEQEKDLTVPLGQSSTAAVEQMTDAGQSAGPTPTVQNQSAVVDELALGGNSRSAPVSQEAAAHRPQLSSSGRAGDGVQTEQLSGDATAVTVDTQVVWFSFAAPTHTQSQVDFTRLDWNLLSTASPAIDSWLNPTNRLSMAAANLVSQHKNRTTAVVACIMTTALDMPGMHFVFKGDDSRRALNTRLSRVVQEDPSCQLMSVLRRYIRFAQMSTIEDAVHISCMPPLITLQKGMLALTRQWRNQLYMPPVTKLGKARRGEYTVHFDLPPTKDGQAELADYGAGSGEEDGAAKDDDHDSHCSDSDDAVEEATERTSLLHPPLGRSPSLASNQSKGKLPVPQTSNLVGASSLGKRVPTAGESSRSDTLSQSCYDNPANDNVDGPADNNLQVYLSQLEHTEKDDDDLYRWMARQQEYSRGAPLGQPAAAAGLGLRRNHSLLRSMVSEVSGETWSQGQGTPRAKSDGPGSSNTGEAIARLADAQLMFRPLLEAVGLNIHGLKSSAIMRNMGGNLSIASKLQSFCIDIVEDCIDTFAASSPVPSQGLPLPPKLTVHHPSQQQKAQSQRPQCFIVPATPDVETSAFSCKLLSISVSLKDTLADAADVPRGASQGSSASTGSRPVVSQTTSDGFQRAAAETSSTLKQQSAHAISVAMRNLEASRPTTRVYVSVDLVGVSQHVNMALLRLVHQVSSVIENMNWTRSQIRKQERLEANQRSQYKKTHRKQDSSSSADTQYACAVGVNAGHVEPLATPVSGMPDLRPPVVSAPASSTPTAVSGVPTSDQQQVQQESAATSVDDPQPVHPVGRGTQMTRNKSSPTPAARRPSKLSLNRHMRKFNLSVKHDPLAAKSPTSPTTAAPSSPAGGSDENRLLFTHSGPDATERQLLRVGLSGVGSSMAYTAIPVVTPAVSTAPPTPDDEPSELPKPTPECWKKLHHLLELYSKTPETKTVTRKHSVTRLSDIVEETECDPSARLGQGSSRQPTIVSAELGQAAPVLPPPPAAGGKEQQQPQQPPTMPPPTAGDHPQRPPADATGGGGPTVQSKIVSPEFTKGMFSQVTAAGENVLLVVCGYVRVHDVNLRAALSGLKLEAEIRNIYGCVTHKAKEKHVMGSSAGRKLSSEMSVTLNVDKSFASLLEDSTMLQLQTVVSVDLSRSYCLYATVTKRKRDYNTAVVSIGAINVSIPQHAGTLHDMVTRSSRRIHDTYLQLKRRNSLAGSAGLAGTPATAGLASTAFAMTVASAVTSNVSLQTALGSLSPAVTATVAATAVDKAGNRAVAMPSLATPAVGEASSAVPSLSDVAGSSASTAAGVDIVDSATGMLNEPITSVAPNTDGAGKRRPKKPFVVHFQVALKSLAVRASLLPSLKAQYHVGQVTWSGISGSRASFAVHVSSHSLSFTSEDRGRDVPLLPSAAAVDLPPMRVDAEYRLAEMGPHKVTDELHPAASDHDYLYAVAEVGVFEHSLTTNLLNHLIVVQKVFVKEVNDVLQKVAGAEKASKSVSKNPSDPEPAIAPLLPPIQATGSPPILYEVILKLKGIQVTATTPTSTAVRLETGSIEMEVSNRMHRTEDASPGSHPQRLKLVFKVHIDINLSLGQLLKNPMFEEADAEFHVVSFFGTAIDVRNALEDELAPASGPLRSSRRSHEAVLINLRRPIFSVQPAAFDKAVMVWLSYRSAYEYWHEQRRNLTSEMQEAVREPVTRARSFAFGSDSGSLSTSIAATRLGLPSRISSDDIVASTLFLQLTITDLGICLPLIPQDTISDPLLSPFSPHTAPASGAVPLPAQTRRHATESEPGNALVLTIRETQINACSCGSLSSRGKFSGFCLRFAKDFEVSLDDWKPDPSEDPVMNACIVQHGTVEVCSQTVSSRNLPLPSSSSGGSPQVVGGAAEDAPSAKWILNIAWEMEGMDANLNTSISQQLSELGRALTALTGDAEDLAVSPMVPSVGSSTTIAGGLASPKSSFGVDDVDASASFSQGESSKRSIADVLDQCYDSDVDPKMRMKLIENEILRLFEHVQELRQLGAKRSDIELEEKKLADLESVLGSEFRREFVDRIRRQSVRANAIRDKLGLSSRLSLHHRSNTNSAGATGQARTKRINTLTPVAEYSSSVLRRSAEEEALDDVDSSIIGALSPHHYAGTKDVNPDTTKVVESASAVIDSRPPSEQPPPRDGTTAIASSSSQPAQGSDQAKVVLRRKPRLAPLNLELPSPLSATPSEPYNPKQQQQPAVLGNVGTAEAAVIDLVLEIMVKIKSGHCTLHPTEAATATADTDKETGKGSRNLKAAHSYSPTGSRKPRGESITSQVLGPSRSPKPPDNRTVFLVPGIELKLHYESRAGSHGSPPSSMQRNVSPSVLHEAPPLLRQQPPTAGLPQSACAQASLTPSVRRPGPKRANLYAWIELQALSEEMVVTTKLLDFLEQALEQIDFAQLRPKARADRGSFVGDDSDSQAGLTEDEAASAGVVGGANASTGPAAVSTFPVDIIVYCSMQPSLIRFSCLPVSRIECLLQLPSLSLVFSTQRNDLDGDTSVPPAGSKKETLAPASSGGGSSSVAGLSVTACMADFSVFVFHPYGGSTAMSGGSASALTRRDAASATPWTASASETQLQDEGSKSGRRIWLSLNMKLLKVHLGRTRRSTMEVAPAVTSLAGSSVAPNAGDKLCNAVKFSMVIDMDSAEFKFDMRRLSDILDLPKAWYRSSLARRMFLGDETSLQQPTTTEAAPPHGSPNLKMPLGNVGSVEVVGPHRQYHRRSMSDGLRGSSPAPLPSQILPANAGTAAVTFATLGSRPGGSGSAVVQKPPYSVGGSRSAGSTLLRTEQHKPKAAAPAGKHRLVGSHADQSGATKTEDGGGGGAPQLSWRTLVLVAVNLSKFDLRINMGNLMGNTVWKTDKLKCQGRLSVDSLGHKEVSASARLEQSDLEAKGGVTGGIIQLSSLNSFVTFRESSGELPSHKLGVGLAAMETKLDYMGTSVLMLRLSDLDAQVFDEWRLSVVKEAMPGSSSPASRVSNLFATLASPTVGTLLGSRGGSSGSSSTKKKSTVNPVQVFVYGNVGFNQLQVMMTKSTTPDLIKMAARVDEYFRQQMRSSKRMFDPSAFGMRSDFGGSSGLGGGTPDAGSAEDVTQSINHRRHWQSVLRRAAGSLLVCQPAGCEPLPPRFSSATLLGGSLGFQGNNLSLACYHGVNFRSKSWVLFIMQEPNVAFATEAHDVKSASKQWKVDTRIVQNFLFSLGQNSTRRLVPYSKMATICKVSRSQMPPTFNTVSEWFAYTFANPELKDFARFDGAGLSGEPTSPTDSTTPRAKASGSGSLSSSVTPSKKSSYKYNHEVETIFALPSLLLQMKTDHMQLYRKPTESDPRPEVLVSFVTEFDGHISVAMDAELIMWLHEVVTAYVRERETQKDLDGKVMEPASSSKFTTDTTGELKKDWREFVCKVWQLEPTVRLLSWAAGRIEPVGVDYILTQLGFRHARTTIPKWIQRGLMDPCDALCAKLVHILLVTMQKKSASDAGQSDSSCSSSDGEDAAPDDDGDSDDVDSGANRVVELRGGSAVTTSTKGTAPTT